MLKYTYKMLKYIYKNPGTTRLTLLEKFQEFLKYEPTIKDYVNIKDENTDFALEAEEQVIQEALKLKLTAGERSEYIKGRRPDIQNTVDDSLISYITNLNFEEALERRKHDRWLFWFPYIVTTFIASLSLIVQIVDMFYEQIMNFICNLK